MAQLSSKFDNLEKSRNDLITYLQGVDKNSLSFKINQNKWSTIQICLHVIKAEQLTTLSLNKNLQLKNNLKKSGFTSLIMDALLSFALKSKIKFKAPAIVAKMPDNYDFDELIKKWNTTRVSLKNYVDNFPEDYLRKVIYKHPIAGWLNLTQTLNFLQNHFDHHKPQIIKLIESHKSLN